MNQAADSRERAGKPEIYSIPFQATFLSWLPWVFLCVLFLRRENRDRRSWYVLIPLLACYAVGELAAMFGVALPTGGQVTIQHVTDVFGFGFAGALLWKRPPRGRSPVHLIKVFAVAATVTLLPFLILAPGGTFDKEVTSGVVIVVMPSAILVAGLSLLCRILGRRFSMGRVLAYLPFSMAVCGWFLMVLAVSVIMLMLPGAENPFDPRFACMGAAMALLGYLLAVPFLLLSQWNGLFGKRVRSWAVAEEPVEHSQGTSE